MKTEIIEIKGNKKLKITGDIDMHTSPELREILLSLIKNSRNQCVCVDFSDVTYIDSSGIATFVEGLKAIRTSGSRLFFYGLPENIMEIFRFSRLDRVFEIYRTFEDAFGI
ncbi:MAG: STAS domain-containing protein [Nitrospirae bacterium]|jgi:anti-sigma B factor antagonist|nr:STAS domain-containing protein [Nitrospirota bacterium]